MEPFPDPVCFLWGAWQISYCLGRHASFPVETAVCSGYRWCKKSLLSVDGREMAAPTLRTEPSASLLLKAAETSFCTRWDIRALKKGEIMTNSIALEGICGFGQIESFSCSLSERCSSRAVSSGKCSLQIHHTAPASSPHAACPTAGQAVSVGWKLRWYQYR